MELCSQLAAPPPQERQLDPVVSHRGPSRCTVPRAPARLRGMAIREPQRRQGAAEPNEGVKLPHPHPS